MFEIKIPYPPSVNHYYRRTEGKRLALTDNAKKFRREVCSRTFEICFASKKYKNLLPFSEPVFVKLQIWPPDKRKRDQDNLLKATFDSLVKAGIILDDRLIKETWITTFDPEPSDPAVLVLIDLQSKWRLIMSCATLLAHNVLPGNTTAPTVKV